jgi:hypothetical protein
MAKLSIIILTGKSENKYKFDVYPFDSELENLKCVYVISNRYLNDENKFTHKIFYVGSTNDVIKIKNELSKNSCIKEKDPNCFSIYVEDEEQKRSQIEKDLKEYYKPPCNN